MIAPTSRGDTKRSGVAESCAATAPPTTVTTTSMSANPSASASDDPTSGSKMIAPRKAPASTGIQSERARPSSRPRPRPLVSQTPHASWFEYAKIGGERAEREVRHGDYDDGLYLAQPCLLSPSRQRPAHLYVHCPARPMSRCNDDAVGIICDCIDVPGIRCGARIRCYRVAVTIYARLHPNLRQSGQLQSGRRAQSPVLGAYDNQTSSCRRGLGGVARAYRRPPMVGRRRAKS